MSPSRRIAAVAAALVLLLPIPGRVAAHAVGGTFELPVPLWLYLAGAGAAVAASFVVLAVASRGSPKPAAIVPIPASLEHVARPVLRALGMVWWYGAIVVGLVIGDISPLPAVLLWIGIWVGLPIVSVLIGNPWPSLSPFRTTFAGLEWLARRAGADRLDLGLTYPPGLARWPAFALLAVAIWVELVLPGGEVAGTVAVLMLSYTVITLGGMLSVGSAAWLRHAELFEVLLGWFGRIGPIGRVSADPALCAGCGEGCDPSRCVDCPECSTTADDGERHAVLRPWAAGLMDAGRSGPSDAAFIILALAGVTYDGLQETSIGGWLFDLVYGPLASLLGPTDAGTFLLAETAQFALVFVSFMAAFVLVIASARLIGASQQRRPLGADLGRYAVTLLPIAGGYLIAHYFTLVIQGIVWLPSLIVDPLMSLAPQLDAIPIALVWYTSVGAIVIGHVIGIVLAHRLAKADDPSRSTIAGLPLVGLMIGYTVLSLWIIAAPLVVEPGIPPAALLLP